jgi:hypothetical protein
MGFKIFEEYYDSFTMSLFLFTFCFCLFLLPFHYDSRYICKFVFICCITFSTLYIFLKEREFNFLELNKSKSKFFKKMAFMVSNINAVFVGYFLMLLIDIFLKDVFK